MAAAVIVLTVSRWRRAAARAEAGRLPVIEGDDGPAVLDTVIDKFAVWVGFPLIVAMMLGSCVLAYDSGDRMMASIGVLGYILGLLLLAQVQRRIGALPASGRRLIRRRGLPPVMVAAVALYVPVLFSQRANPWVSGACAVAAAGSSLIIGRWQYVTLLAKAPAAGPTGIGPQGV